VFKVIILKVATNLYRYPVRYLAAMLGGMLLALPYNFPNGFLLAWFAFVPLLWATSGVSLRQVYSLGAVFGITFYVMAAHWIVDFILLYKGGSLAESMALALLFWIYCAQLPALMIVLFYWLSARVQLSSYVIFPVIVTVLYSSYPMLFSVQLGESQSRFISALQAIEFTGVYGLDFIIALVNILIYDGLSKIRSSNASGDPDHSSGCSSGVIVLAVLSAWLLYGRYSLSHWDELISHWSTRSVGLVQSNEIPSADYPPPVPGYSRSYPPEWPLTEKLAAAGVDFVVWPETRFKGYYRYSHIRRAFQDHASRLGVPIVFQDSEYLHVNGRQEMFNTAALLNEQGELENHYRKIKRVPFGEYLPIIDDWPGMKALLYPKLSDFFVDFSKGEGPAVFHVEDVILTPLICYEIMLAEFTARSVGQAGMGKVIVALSNNSWFGDSFQPIQHVNASLLRSVENRVPMIHVTNNGPSVAVLPNGRILAQTENRNLQALQVDLPFSSKHGGSFFSRNPGWFLCLIRVLFIVLLVLAMRKRLLMNSQKILAMFSR
jgi:apolipoprotein N-acyltransferase